jgi:hypothetical protein
VGGSGVSIPAKSGVPCEDMGALLYCHHRFGAVDHILKRSIKTKSKSIHPTSLRATNGVAGRGIGAVENRKLAKPIQMN